MNVWIVFFRGINVGGRNIVRMAELRELLEGIDCSAVQTYIQSGNVVLRSGHVDSAALERVIQAAFNARFSFEPQVLAMKLQQLSAAYAGNPFPVEDADPKTLHLFFLSQKAAASCQAKLEQLQSKTERFLLARTVLYLHAPDGIGRSKFAANVEKTLSVSVTARNWRSVGKVLQMAETLANA